MDYGNRILPISKFHTQVDKIMIKTLKMNSRRSSDKIYVLVKKK